MKLRNTEKRYFPKEDYFYKLPSGSKDGKIFHIGYYISTFKNVITVILSIRHNIF